MIEKKYDPEQAGTAQEQEVENNLYNFLSDNQGSAYTMNALINRLEEIVNKQDNLEFVKQNLKKILDIMEKKGLIDLHYHDRENHYFVPEAKAEVPESGGSLNLEPIKDWIKEKQNRALGWSVLFGLLVGLLSVMVVQARELLFAVSILVVTLSLIGEIIVNRNSSKNDQKYSFPVYGFIALVLDIIGLIIIRPIGLYTFSFGVYEMTIGVILAIFALIFGATSLYRHDVNHATMSLGSTFLGAIILIVCVFPLLVYALGISVFFLVGGW